jgi:hypothetical protein
MKALVALVLGFALAGCGSSSGGGSASSGVDATKRLDALSAAEKGQLCDWIASKMGGYGHTTSCGSDLTLDAPANQAECVAEMPATCAATVAQAEACQNQTSCTNPLPEACAPIIDCILGGGGV